MQTKISARISLIQFNMKASVGLSDFLEQSLDPSGTDHGIPQGVTNRGIWPRGSIPNLFVAWYLDLPPGWLTADGRGQRGSRSNSQRISPLLVLLHRPHWNHLLSASEPSFFQLLFFYYLYRCTRWFWASIDVSGSGQTAESRSDYQFRSISLFYRFHTRTADALCRRSKVSSFFLCP